MPLPKYEFVYELSIEKDILYYIKKRPVVFFIYVQPISFKVWTTYFFFD